MDLTPKEWDVFMAGHDSGYRAGLDHGIDMGRAWQEAELAAIQRAAVHSVRAAADLPPRDREADRARRARIDARFARTETVA